MNINPVILIIVAVALIGLVLYSLFRDRKEEDEFGLEVNDVKDL